MKTRINKIFSTNSAKLKNIIYNRYNLDKKDRKSLNNVNTNNKGINWEYINIENAPLYLRNAIIGKCFLVKYYMADFGEYDITGAFDANGVPGQIVAIMIDLDNPYWNNRSAREIIKGLGYEDEFNSQPRLTKEEFYSK